MHEEIDQNIESLASNTDDNIFKPKKTNPKKLVKKSSDEDKMQEETFAEKDKLRRPDPFSQISKLEPFDQLADGKIIFSELGQNERKNWGLQGSDLTLAFFDRSGIFNELLVREFEDDDDMFLGELQFSFVVFLLGENYDGFEQWKQMVFLFTNSKKLMLERFDLYRKGVIVLFNQIRQFPVDFFFEDLTKNNFLVKSFRDFYSNVDSLGGLVDRIVKSRCEKLKYLLENTFGVIFPNDCECSEDDDEKPVIVEDFDFIKF